MIFNPIERMQIEDVETVFAKLYERFEGIKNKGYDIEALRAKITQERLLLETYLESIKYSMMILQKKHTADPVSNVHPFDYKNVSIIETPDKANIDTRFKFISAAILSKTVYKDLRISIEDGSNGFPGNTHEIEGAGPLRGGRTHATGASTGASGARGSAAGGVVFRGQNSPFINLKNLLSGSDVFEYEFYRVSEPIMELTQNMGFHYREGKSFVSSHNELFLKLRFDFPSPRVINMLTLSPYILSSLGYSYCDVTELSVYAKDGVRYPVIDNGAGHNREHNRVQFKHTLTYVFPAIECSHFIIGFMQPKGYDTQIGHFYREFNGIRLDTEKDSLKLLGFGYNENSNELVQPNTDIQDVSAINLFPLFNKNYRLEILPAERFVIGLSRIEVSNCLFRTQSSVISKPISTPGLNNFRITTNQNDYKIDYYISLNNGQWIPAEKDKVHEVSEIVITEPVEEVITTEDRTAETVMHEEAFDPESITSISYKIEFNIEGNNIPILYDFFLETEVTE